MTNDTYECWKCGSYNVVVKSVVPVGKLYEMAKVVVGYRGTLMTTCHDCQDVSYQFLSEPSES